MRVPESLPARAGVVLVGALTGGVIAALASTVLPSPYPLAVGIAAAVPVMDVGIYPENVPAGASVAARVGVSAAVGGALAGCVVGWAWLAFSLPFPTGFAIGTAYLAAEFAGSAALSRLT
ncbi:hypothetical protein [Salarchaeum sp. JOR-1]|uniref:hypothetical protein n=1 Tax=Salarchaeum sp. JOR-1 TaxID=2599399 RepID=UPI0011985857|nr:hypothetical protein [Salarchaeum sp. JOR-1]QDX39760.1 hypothetical protein FQU85_02175 [Salarchaeum sp. JOR-1]